MRHKVSSLAAILMLTLGFNLTLAAQQPQPREVPARVDTVDDDRRDGVDWGWLGLLGLAGLMGLKRRESHARPVRSEAAATGLPR